MNLKPEKHSNDDPTPKPPPPTKGNKIWVAIAVVITFGILSYFSRSYLKLEFLANQANVLKTYFADHPTIVYTVAFAIYVIVTGLSVPGATVLTLIYAWFFGFVRGLILVSFASTAGATLAFLISRYLLRDWIQKKFEKRLTVINRALEREGIFYLFLMRLIPAFPFFVVNAVMGLTKIKAFTFWWVSQLGMLAGTAVYVYAGSTIPDLTTLKKEGIGAVFTTSQLTQITIALLLLGLFPIAAKKLAQRFRADRL